MNHQESGAGSMRFGVAVRTAAAIMALASVAIAESPTIPEQVANHKPAWLNQPAPNRRIPPLKQFFPLGVYGGSYGEQTWNFVLDDLVQHHMNCWWLNGGGLDDDMLDRLFTKAEQAGLRIYWQDSGDAMYYLWKVGTPESRRARYQRTTVPLVHRRAARFKDRWGLLCWGLCEEMAAPAVEEMAEYFRLVQKEDSNHPPLFLYNKTDAAKKAVELLRPEVVATDIYPLGRDPRCAPDNVPSAQNHYRRVLRGYHEIARSGGAALWIIAQGMGSGQAYKDEEPWNGWMGGYYMPNPPFCAWEAWAAVQEGATGIFYYHYFCGRDHKELTLRTELWNETCQLQAIGACFAEIEKAAPYLVDMQRDEGVVQIASSERDIELAAFKPCAADIDLGIVIAVNNNIFNQRTFKLMHVRGTAARIWDLAADQDVTETNNQAKLLLKAGVGKVLAIGTPEEIAKFKRACLAGR